MLFLPPADFFKIIFLKRIFQGDDVRGRRQLAGQLFNKIFPYYLKILISIEHLHAG